MRISLFKKQIRKFLLWKWWDLHIILRNQIPLFLSGPLVKILFFLFSPHPHPPLLLPQISKGRFATLQQQHMLAWHARNCRKTQRPLELVVNSLGQRKSGGVWIVFLDFHRYFARYATSPCPTTGVKGLVILYSPRWHMAWPLEHLEESPHE